MRTPQEQEIHDKVLEDSARSYLRITTPENIQTNPGELRNYDIEGKYPDVIIKLKTGEIIIEEIETESTVNETSLEKWRQFSNLGHEVRIIVPLSRVDLAKDLASKLTIPVIVQAYEVSGDKIRWLGKNA